MKTKASISFECDSKETAEKALKIMQPELNVDNERERTDIKLEVKDNKFIVTIDSKDPVAMRATVNTYLKLMLLYSRINLFTNLLFRRKK